MTTIEVDGIKEAFKRAEAATAEIKDQRLRKIAFEKLVDRILSGPPLPPVTGRRKGSQSPRKIERPNSKGQQKSGPMSWLRDLVEEDFFKQQRTVGEIRSKLGERGHFLDPHDISGQLEKLMDERLLRRKKVSKGKGTRQVWAYSNW